MALFSGGNDGIEDGRSGTYGNVQVYIRKEGSDAANPLTRLHRKLHTLATNRYTRDDWNW